ncbi:LVIVD repeat-containing protein [Desulfoluna spongiiphila]|uniref:hypothetical protein n=1 Tax=Desulfoluna spongiiphila TaxID=419481 RepID=UPI00125367E2|nr:hypothetical protein [Desulfoluna spongiiphila]VVS95206.1 lvivd [Desulfoluna spongiiphila]
MINRQTLTLFLAIFLLPALTWADAFSPMGTRWPAGVKKTLVGNSTTLFGANGDILAAYPKGAFQTTAPASIRLNAPEGIATLDYLEIGGDKYIIAACGTGGLQVVKFDGTSFTLHGDAVVTESTHPRKDNPSPAVLNIAGCVGFEARGAHLIATIDNNFGYRVFKFTTTPSLEEVARQELSRDLYTMLVDIDRWNKEPGHDCILTVAQNREMGLLDITKGIHDQWEIKGLGKLTFDIPNLPSTALLYMSTLTLRVADDTAHVVENSMGHFLSFGIQGTPPYLSQTYPIADSDGITLGYPLDLSMGGAYACITTLADNNDNPPGVQVMKLANKAVVGTLAQEGAGAVHQTDATTLFLMDIKSGLSKISLVPPGSPAQGPHVATPFAVDELLARENHLFFVDGLDSDKAGVRVMDILNATQPKCVFFGPTNGRACDLAVDKDFYRLFVADKSEGVYCYSMNSDFVSSPDDLDNPEPPSPIAPLPLATLGIEHFDGESPLSITVSSKNHGGVNTDYLHVLTEGGKLFSFPLPVPLGSPQIHTIDTDESVDFVDLPGTPKTVEPFASDYLLVACGPQGLQVVDLFSNPDTPGTLSHAIEASHTAGLSNTVNVSSDGTRHACVADDGAGIVTLDLFADQNTPALITLAKKSSYTIDSGHVIDLFLTDNNNLYAVTDQSSDNLLILDMSDPSTPGLLSRETSPGSPRAIVAATTGGLSSDSPSLRAAYIADGQGGLTVRQTTNDDNSQEQVWHDDSSSCFIQTLR